MVAIAEIVSRRRSEERGVRDVRWKRVVRSSVMPDQSILSGAHRITL